MTAKLWQTYKMSGDEDAKGHLITLYAPLVKYVAGRLSVNLPKSVEEGDLIGYGSLGLIDAIQRYDPMRGVKFETYAIARIKGSMIDGLRSMDWAPVSVRQKNRAFEEAVRDLENRLGRSATDQEIISDLGITMKEYSSRLQDLATSSIFSLEDVLGSFGENDPWRKTPEVKDERAPDPLEETLWASKKEDLAKGIKNLPERERLIVTLYYYEGLTVKEIARVLGVSPSRVSQLHTKAVSRLKRFLNT